MPSRISEVQTIGRILEGERFQEVARWFVYGDGGEHLGEIWRADDRAGGVRWMLRPSWSGRSFPVLPTDGKGRRPSRADAVAELEAWGAFREDSIVIAGANLHCTAVVTNWNAQEFRYVATASGRAARIRVWHNTERVVEEGPSGALGWHCSGADFDGREVSAHGFGTLRDAVESVLPTMMAEGSADRWRGGVTSGPYRLFGPLAEGAATSVASGKKDVSMAASPILT